jgi:hypothetical protein
MRTILHFTPKRIEAHICNYFVTSKGYKGLEHIRKFSKINMVSIKYLTYKKP